MIFDRPRPPPIILAMIALVLALSLVVALDARGGGDLYLWLALSPARVWRGEVWRLVTWAFVELGPWSLVFACLSLYWFGGDLVEVWGPRRFATYVAATVLGAGAGTAVISVALAPPAAQLLHLGGWALDDAILIAWALRFPTRGLRVLYGSIVLYGRTLAYCVAGFTVLCALYAGLAAWLPELLACALALTHARGWPRPRWPRPAPTTPRRRERGPYHTPDSHHN